MLSVSKNRKENSTQTAPNMMAEAEKVNQIVISCVTGTICKSSAREVDLKSLH